MCCLSKREAYRAYRILLEIEGLEDKDDLWFQKEDNKLLLWVTYFILLSPLFHVLYCLLIKYGAYGL